MKKRWRGLCALWLAVLLICYVPTAGLAADVSGNDILLLEQSQTAEGETGGADALAQTYTITLPTGEGYTAASAEGQSTTVNAGGSYTFTVEIKQGYVESDFTVSANGNKLTMQEITWQYTYTIENVSEDQVIEVTGVVPGAAAWLYTGSDSLHSGLDLDINLDTSKKEDKKIIFGKPLNEQKLVEQQEGLEGWSIWTCSSGGIVANQLAEKYAANGEISAEYYNSNVTGNGNDFMLLAPIWKTLFQITKSETAGGSCTVTKDGSEVTEAYEGAAITVTPQPDPGYVLDKITVTADGSEVSLSENSFTMPGASVAVDVSFVKQRFSITLPTGEGYTASADGQELSVEYDGSFTFTVAIAEGYEAGDSFAVTAGGTALTPSGVSGNVYTYTIENIRASQNIAVAGVVESVVKTPFSIVKSETAGGSYTVTKDGSEVTEAYEGETVTVTAKPDIGYVLEKITVTAADGSELVNETEALEKSFTMPGSSVTVDVSFTKQSFSVTLPTGEGYTAASADGQSTTVNAGKSYTFTVTVERGYLASSDFKVSANGTELTNQGASWEPYTYKIESISENQEITVTGVAPGTVAWLYKGNGQISTGTSIDINSEKEDKEVLFGKPLKDQGFAGQQAGLEGWTVWSCGSGGAISRKINEYAADGAVSSEDYGKVETDGYMLLAPVVKTPFAFTLNPVTEGGSYTVTKGGSEVTEAYEGDQITVTAQPDTGYRLEQITVRKADGSSVEVSENSFTMPGAAVTVEVSFVKLRFSVNLPTGDGYTVSADGQDLSAEYDGSFTFTVTIAEGYKAGDSFAVTAGGTALTPTNVNGNVYTYTINNIKIIQVVAVAGVVESPVKTPFSIAKSETAGGSYTVTKDGGEVTEAYEGDTITVTAQPGTGYRLEKIAVRKADGSEVVNETGALEKSFTMPDASVTVEVSFVKLRFSVTLPTGDGYTASADGQDLSAEYDGSFTFTVTIAEGYKAGDSFAVTAGGTALTPTHVNGNVYTYTIRNIRVLQVVAVAGVVEETVPGEDDGGGNGTPGGPISQNGTYQLQAGTAYVLGEGTWKVAGDSTVYRGGITFYVSQSGEYVFEKQ